MVKIGKNVGKNISKYNLGMVDACQKRLHHTKKSVADAFKTALKREIKNTADTTGDLIGKSTANKITKNSSQNNSDTDSQPK